MLAFGHYIKHSPNPNRVLKMFMANNFHNLPSYVNFVAYIIMNVMIGLKRVNTTEVEFGGFAKTLVVMGILAETAFCFAIMYDWVNNARKDAKKKAA